MGDIRLFHRLARLAVPSFEVGRMRRAGMDEHERTRAIGDHENVERGGNFLQQASQTLRQPRRLLFAM